MCVCVYWPQKFMTMPSCMHTEKHLFAQPIAMPCFPFLAFSLSHSPAMLFFALHLSRPISQFLRHMNDKRMYRIEHRQIIADGQSIGCSEWKYRLNGAREWERRKASFHKVDIKSYGNRIKHLRSFLLLIPPNITINPRCVQVNLRRLYASTEYRGKSEIKSTTTKQVFWIRFKYIIPVVCYNTLKCDGRFFFLFLALSLFLIAITTFHHIIVILLLLLESNTKLMHWYQAESRVFFLPFYFSTNEFLTEKPFIRFKRWSI